MLDTRKVPFFRPSISEAEIKEVSDSLRSGWLTTGPKTKRFEEEIAAFVGAKYAVALNSCTAALHLALEAIDLKRGDLVSVEDWWERAKRRDFVVVKNYYNLDPFILEPKEALYNSLLAGRRLMDTDTEEEKDWIAAEEALMAVQNINFTTKDDDIKKMLAEVYFRIGEIAYHLQDYEVAVQYLKYGMRQGYRPRHAGRLIEEAEEWAVYEWPVDPRPLSVHPIQFPEFPRGFGSVHLNLGGREFLEVQTEIKEGKTQAKSAQELDAHIYGVAGGRGYKMVFDIRKQLRKAALQGGSAVLLMGILLML